MSRATHFSFTHPSIQATNPSPKVTQIYRWSRYRQMFIFPIIIRCGNAQCVVYVSIVTSKWRMITHYSLIWQINNTLELDTVSSFPSA